MKKRLSSSSFLYCLFRFFQDAALIYPVYIIMFRDSGLSFPQIAALLAVWAAAVMLLELPCGILADVWNRRNMLVIAMVMKACGFACWLLWPEYYGFLAGFVFWGLQEAMTSGTADALLYETLLSEGRPAQFETIAGLGGFASRAAIVISMVLGGYLYSIDPPVVLGISVAAMLLGALCIIPLADTRPRTAQQKPGTVIRSIIASMRAAWKIPGMAALVVFGSIAGAAYGVLDEYDTIFGEYRGVPLALVGVWGAFRFMLEGAGSLLAPVLRTRLHIHKPQRLALWCIAAAVLLVIGASGPDFVLPLYFIFYCMMAAFEILFQGIIQRRIESDCRASFASFASFLYSGAGIGIGLLFGAAAGRKGLPVLFITGACIIILSSCGYLWQYRRAVQNDE